MFYKLEIVRNSRAQLLTPHMSQSEKYWPRKMDFSIFEIFAIFNFSRAILGAKISNRPIHVVVSKNRENLDFEITRFIGVRSA